MNAAHIHIIRQKITEIRACLSELPDNEYQMEQLQLLEDALDRIEEDTLLQAKEEPPDTQCARGCL